MGASLSLDTIVLYDRLDVCVGALRVSCSALGNIGEIALSIAVFAADSESGMDNDFGFPQLLPARGADVFHV